MKAPKSPAETGEITLVKTGIAGLDEVLHGGLTGDSACSRWTRRNSRRAKHGLNVRVRGQARVRSDASKAFLYRTAPELLFNAVKHAQVKEANGREAVDLAERLHPDVVIMDASMPEMGGAEAARRIKQNLPRTPVVSLSTFDEPEVRARMRDAGADSYVLKTAPTKELLAAIRGREPSTREAPE